MCGEGDQQLCPQHALRLVRDGPRRGRPADATSRTAELSARVLSAAIAASARRQDDSAPTPFNSTSAPSVPLSYYVHRFRKYAGASSSVFVIALAVIDRYLEAKGAVPSELNVHRLWCTGFAIAAKAHDDVYCSNALYASIGGMTLEELNRLEVELLVGCDFCVAVNPSVYAMYDQLLSRSVSPDTVQPATA